HGPQAFDPHLAAPSERAVVRTAGRPPPPRSHRAGAPAPGAPGWPHYSLRQEIAWPRIRPAHRPPRARAKRPPDSQWYASRLAAPTTPARISPPEWDSCLLSPSYVLHLRCVLSLLGSARLWGRTTGDRHHSFV